MKSNVVWIQAKPVYRPPAKLIIGYVVVLSVLTWLLCKGLGW